jgi:hypothetical protein
MPAAKRCPRCEQTKPAAAFGACVRYGRPKLFAYCLDCTAAYHRDRRTDPAKAARDAAHLTASIARHPERRKARLVVRRARLAGRIQPAPCYAAGADCRGPIEAHHADYRRPLDVVWTCRHHHRALDRARRSA